MTDQTWLGNVAYALHLRGLEAELTHTGGGIWCVEVAKTDGGYLCWGVSGETWGADNNAADGDLLEPFDGIWTDVPSDSADLAAVTGAIYTASVTAGAKQEATVDTLKDALHALIEAFKPYHHNDIAGRPWLENAITLADYKCRACGRAERLCSADPCPDVIADREEEIP